MTHARTLSRFRRAHLVLVGLLASACVSEAAVVRDSQSEVSDPVPSTSPLPDGTSELLIAQGEDFGSGPVVLARTDGTIVETIAPQGYGAVFSPDGTKVAFVAVDEAAPTGQETAVSVWSRDGSVTSALSTGGIASDLQWSPTGDRLLFSSVTVVGDSSATAHVRVADAETLQHEAIRSIDTGEAAVVVHKPSWTADGSGALLFDAMRSVAIRANLDDGTSETVDLPFSVGFVRHSPTEDRIVIVGDSPPDEGVRRGLYLASGDGSNLTRFGGDASDVASISWSPDGRKLVTVTDGEWTIWAGNADEGNSGASVDSTAFGLFAPVWSPSAAWRDSSDEPVFASTIASTGEVALIDIQGDVTPIGLFGRVTDWRAG